MNPRDLATDIAPAAMKGAAGAVSAWKAKFRGAGDPVQPPVEPARDELREIMALRIEAKLEPLKRSGRLIVNFKTPAEGQAALAAVLAVA